MSTIKIQDLRFSSSFDLFIMASQKRLGISHLPDIVRYRNPTRYSICNRQREQT